MCVETERDELECNHVHCVINLSYLQDLIQYRSARPGLRSAGILLNVPMTRSVTYGDRAFCSIGPTWWNSLPSELKTSPSVDSFKRNLKTHLFKLAYGQ